MLLYVAKKEGEPMNYIETNLKNDDGSIETLLISSVDNYPLNMTKRYKLANYPKSNKLVNKFKNSILGADIGIKSSGFSHVAIIATITAIGAFCTLYLMWRI